MAILRNIRNRAGSAVLVIVVFCLIVMILGGDVGRSISLFFENKQDYIGDIDGHHLSSIDYGKYLEKYYYNFQRKGNKLIPAEESNLKNAAWNQLLQDTLYAQEARKAGVLVGVDEVVDLVQGEHIDPTITAAFQDPQTGCFDKRKLLDRLSSLNKHEQEGWYAFEQELALKRTKDKINNLMQKSYFTTKLEEEQALLYTKASCVVDYLYIPFDKFDHSEKPTPKQMSDYMADNKAIYKAKESKIIRYISLPIEPSEQDNALFQEDLSRLVADFSAATDPYEFAKQYTDGNISNILVECTADELPNMLVPYKHTLKKGMIVGPTMTAKGLYRLYKIRDIKKENNTYLYTIVLIEKRTIIGDTTRNKLYRELENIVHQAKNLTELERVSTEQNLSVLTATVHPSDGAIGKHSGARNVVRWLYNKASLGTISEVFDVGDAYLVVVMTDQIKADGLVPLDTVYHEVYDKLIRKQKAEFITDKLKKIQATTLDGIKAQYIYSPIESKLGQRIQFDNKHEDVQLQNAQAFIGCCFGLPIKNISSPIVDETGVFVPFVQDRSMPVPDKDHTNDESPASTKPNKKMTEIEQWLEKYYTTAAMEESANVRDKRYRLM